MSPTEAMQEIETAIVAVERVERWLRQFDARFLAGADAQRLGTVACMAAVAHRALDDCEGAIGRMNLLVFGATPTSGGGTPPP